MKVAIGAALKILEAIAPKLERAAEGLSPGQRSRVERAAALVGEACGELRAARSPLTCRGAGGLET